ncbi:MAG: hypothetical protein ACRD2P_06045 [Terriglobia bacterium]
MDPHSACAKSRAGRSIQTPGGLHLSAQLPFGLKFSNIPLINLRMEFNDTYAFLSTSDAEECLKPPVKPIRARLFIWGGMPDDFMTLVLQRAVLGIEAYLPGALMHTSSVLGNLSKELVAKLKNPFSFGSKSAVANIYDRMPAAVHPELSLLYLDQDLYGRNVLFYREVRNPLFHGQQLTQPTISSMREAFLHLAHLYAWIDYWFDPEKLIKGGGIFAGVHLRNAKKATNYTR